MTKKTIDWTLFRKVLDHTADEKEQAEFDKWLQSDPRHREYYGRARRFYAGESAEPLPLDETFAALKARLEMHDRPMYRRRSYYGIAAAVAVIVVLSCFDWHRDNAETAMDRVCCELAREYAPATDKARLIVNGGECYDLHGEESLSLDVRGGHIERGDDNRLVYTADAEAEVVQNKLLVPRGGYYSVLLEDGTTVHLNAESELVYPSAFSKDVRTVSLVGEAYFDVAHDAGRPFVVEVDGYSIEVLGTQFNVTAYADERICRSTLVEGSVRIIPDNGRNEEEIVLTPGEQVVHETGTDIFSVARVNTKVYTAWMGSSFSKTPRCRRLCGSFPAGITSATTLRTPIWRNIRLPVRSARTEVWIICSGCCMKRICRSRSAMKTECCMSTDAKACRLFGIILNV